MLRKKRVPFSSKIRTLPVKHKTQNIQSIVIFCHALPLTERVREANVVNHGGHSGEARSIRMTTAVPYHPTKNNGRVPDNHSTFDNSHSRIRAQSFEELRLDDHSAGGRQEPTPMALTGENTTANPSGNSEESEGARSEADRAARPFAAPAPATSSGGTEASASSTLGGAGETPPATKAGDAKADEPASRSVPGWPPSLASPFGASPFGPPPESQARGFGHGVASSTPKMCGFSFGTPAAPAAEGGFNFGGTAPDKTETKTPVSAAPAVMFRSGVPLGAGIGLGGTGTKDAPATAGFSFGAPVSPAFGSGLGGLASAGPSTAFPFGLGGSSANANAPNSTKGWSPFSGACTAFSSTKQNGWLFSSAPSFAAESVPVPKSGKLPTE